MLKIRESQALPVDLIMSLSELARDVTNCFRQQTDVKIPECMIMLPFDTL